MGEVIYPPCKYCGATHGMGIENVETGVIEPIDVCKDCLWFGEAKYIKEQIVLDPIGDEIREWKKNLL